MFELHNYFCKGPQNWFVVFAALYQGTGLLFIRNNQMLTIINKELYIYFTIGHSKYSPYFPSLIIVPEPPLS